MRTLANRLSRDCHCVTIDRPLLAATLERSMGEGDIVGALEATHPHLFAAAPVFVSRGDADAMLEVVGAIEDAVRYAPVRDAILAHAPAIAQRDHGPAGAFMGYDFHLSADGPKLIEVNTNAGGAFLNAHLANAQRACCGFAGALALSPRMFDASVAAMFANEWKRQRSSGRPALIAIADDAPERQFLYPEFLVAQRVLRDEGFDTIIADAAAFSFEHDALHYEGRAVDLVYNRLVDFALEEGAHRPLRDAYEAGAVVLTPNPHNHALFADKRNLALLSDSERLAQLGLPSRTIRALRRLPQTRVVAAGADALWAERKRYFFKPFAGYGGKAVYRGDKLTLSAWARIREGGYVAQEIVPPSERNVRVGEEDRVCKVDVRVYTYEGRPLLMAARLYQGQTTNFRTEGGGFAPVLIA
jgi:hypothetical protein